jgi:transcriptional regulator with PAS, ATPase and Fis domain
MNNTFLVSWIGSTDIKAAKGVEGAGIGPIAQVISASGYTEIHLLSNFSADESRVFVDWLSVQTVAKIRSYFIDLSSPTNHREIYLGVVPILNMIVSFQSTLTYNLSSGTPAMHAIWVLLAKTSHPGFMLQTSREEGVEKADIPFDIAAEFIPHLLQKSDKRLSQLSSGSTADNAVFSDIIHRSEVMKQVIEQARRVALHSVPVLIEGESGTGKELMAKAIHHASPRTDQPFIPVNCGAIPVELIESEFFGHKKGAFTGANAERKGHFEQAHGGTLFLDEIGELPKTLQVKLLRALQESVITPVGSSEERKVDVRIIAATNRTLIDEVTKGEFREDLFYRLAVAIIKLPPLRDRAGDLSLLIEKLLEQVNKAGETIGIKHKNISVSAINVMNQHPWPGNVRELLNTLQRAVIWTDGKTIDAETMRNSILIQPKSLQEGRDILDRPIEKGVPLEELMAEVARHYLSRAFEHTKNKTKAAELLGLGSYQTFTNWVEKYGKDD